MASSLPTSHQVRSQERRHRQHQRTEGGASGGVLDLADRIRITESGEVGWFQNGTRGGPAVSIVRLQ
jgi:hypothetical protein